MKIIQNLTQRIIIFGIEPGVRRSDRGGRDSPAIKLVLGGVSKDPALPLDANQPHKVILAEWCAKASKQFGVDLKPDDVAAKLEGLQAFRLARDGASGFKLQGRTAAPDRAPQIVVA